MYCADDVAAIERCCIINKENALLLEELVVLATEGKILTPLKCMGVLTLTSVEPTFHSETLKVSIINWLEHRNGSSFLLFSHIPLTVL